jgi:hypothetical protein
VQQNTLKSISRDIGSYRCCLTCLIRSLQTYIVFPSKGTLAIVSILIVALYCGLHSSGNSKNGFGFVSVTTAQAAPDLSHPDSFAGGVVVALTQQNTGNEIYVLTDKFGTALVPLLEGTYCGIAYGTDGTLLKLDQRLGSESKHCFVTKRGQAIEFSLTIAPGVTYSNQVPSLGVQ